MAKQANESGPVAFDPELGESRPVGDDERVLDGVIQPGVVDSPVRELATVQELETENRELKEQVAEIIRLHGLELDEKNQRMEELLGQQDRLVAQMAQQERQHKEEVEALKQEVKETQDHAERKNPAIRQASVDQAVRILTQNPDVDGKRVTELAASIEQYISGTGEDK